MKDKRSSVDGFITRQPGSGARIGGLHDHDSKKAYLDTPPNRDISATDAPDSRALGQSIQHRSLGRADLDESLRSIDEVAEPEKKRSRRWRRKAKRAKHTSRTRKIIKRTILILLVIFLLFIGYIFVRFLVAGGNIFQGNIFDILQSRPLKEDSNGRSNFLVFGTEAENHPGANLTDSIMLISINQHDKNAYMISLPRDLWVQYPERCWVGDQGKINAVYTCASNDGEDVAAGTQALQEVASQVTGLDIHYYVHANWNAVVEGVDAIGGIDITIESDDPRGILDRNFDWTCDYRCYYVNYDNGEEVHLDGEHALALARARNAQGGYGINDNFGREKNQQAIIRAMLDKTVSVGTLTNLSAITGLIDTLGDNLLTNIETKEIRTLAGLGMDVSPEDIISISLVDEDEPLLTTGSYGEQSIVRPIRGLLDYTDIKAYIARYLSNDPAIREAAPMAVFNGTEINGFGQERANELAAKGYNITLVSNAPAGSYDTVEIYQIGSGNDGTAEQLESLFSTKVTRDVLPPVIVSDDVKFVVIFGGDPSA